MPRSKRKQTEDKEKRSRKPGEDQKRGNGASEPSPLLATTSQASEEVRQLLEAAGDASRKIRDSLAEVPSSERPVGGNETSQLIGKINSEVQHVLESAEEAAEKIRAEARAEARRVVEETRRRAEGVTREHLDRVSETSEQLLGELAAIQTRLQSLRRAFDDSISKMGTELEVEEADVWSTRQNGAEQEEAAELRNRLGHRASQRTVQEPEEISEGARLLAMQQLIAGADPEAIEERLRQQFGIEDPKPILEWMGVQAEQPEKAEKPKKR